ncbi:MAG: DUF3150 domain-containing protein, partial [Sutterellaceae bacterium]|nr:DUF3150 domain-containing protein [Sutterellaceae bacterium]
MTTVSNVTNSNNAVALRCTTLPAEMAADQLVLIYLFFKQWSGVVSMAKTDYSVGKDGSLPPDEVTANYGQKRVIDPQLLAGFTMLKRRAEVVLADVGLPFCKGTVVPMEKAADVVNQLTALAQEYNAKRDEFVANLQTHCQDWINRNPQFASNLPIPSATDIAKRIDANFAVMQFKPLGNGIDTTKSLDKSIHGLFDEVIDDVTKRARTLLRRSVLGKAPEDLSQRTLSTLKVMHEKLVGLQFLNTGVRPIVSLLERLLSIMPRRGKFTPNEFNILSAALGLLSDEELMREVANGTLTLDQYISSSFNQINLPNQTLPMSQPVVTQAQPAVPKVEERPAAVPTPAPVPETSLEEKATVTA